MSNMLQLRDIKPGDRILSSPKLMTREETSDINSGKVPYYRKFFVSSVQPTGLMSSGVYFSSKKYNFELLEWS